MSDLGPLTSVSEPELVQLRDAADPQPSIASSDTPSKAIMRSVEHAIHKFDLIKNGDRVAVGCSGGKDSLLLISVFKQLMLRHDLSFDFQVIHLDQGQPGFDHVTFERSLKRLDVECEIIDRDTWSVVEQKLKPGQIPCSICSRMRRGILNDWCAENGYNKLALGHHLDDALETFFLNLLFGRRLDPLKAMTPASASPTLTIRPLLFVDERKIRSWLSTSGIGAVACPVCDTFPRAKRRDIKTVIQQFAALNPDIYQSVEQAVYGSTSPWFKDV
ncbi:MAG: ATP-binding protein [Myxococcota bacterium]|nr:ATP-binding protein [Myxococcota bacterium]